MGGVVSSSASTSSSNVAGEPEVSLEIAGRSEDRVEESAPDNVPKNVSQQQTQQPPDEYRWHFPEASRGDQQVVRALTPTGMALQLDALSIVYQHIGMSGEHLLKKLRRAGFEGRQKEGWTGIGGERKPRPMLGS